MDSYNVRYSALFKCVSKSSFYTIHVYLFFVTLHVYLIHLLRISLCKYLFLQLRIWMTCCSYIPIIASSNYCGLWLSTPHNFRRNSCLTTVWIKKTQPLNITTICQWLVLVSNVYLKLILDWWILDHLFYLKLSLLHLYLSTSKFRIWTWMSHL